MKIAQTKKTLLMASLALATVAGVAFALDQPVDVEAQFRVAIQLSSTKMDFTPGAKYIEFSGTPGASDYVTLGTDGTLTNNGGLNDNAGTGTPGQVLITGDNSSTVDVTCTVSATMYNVSGSTSAIGVDQLEIVHHTGAAYAGGHACAGLGTTPLSFNLDGATDDVLLGGRVGLAAVVGAYTSDIYSTAATNGIPAQVRVVYQ